MLTGQECGLIHWVGGGLLSRVLQSTYYCKVGRLESRVVWLNQWWWLKPLRVYAVGQQQSCVWCQMLLYHWLMKIIWSSAFWLADLLPPPPTTMLLTTAYKLEFYHTSQSKCRLWICDLRGCSQALLFRFVIIRSKQINKYDKNLNYKFAVLVYLWKHQSMHFFCNRKFKTQACKKRTGFYTFSLFILHFATYLSSQQSSCSAFLCVFLFPPGSSSSASGPIFPKGLWKPVWECHSHRTWGRDGWSCL